MTNPEVPRRGPARSLLLLGTLALLAGACAGTATSATEPRAAGTTVVTVPGMTTGGADGTVEVVTSRTTMHIAKMQNGTVPPPPPHSAPFSVEFKGHRIRGVEIPGAEPAIVLTHGFPDNIHLYDRLYPLLDGKRRVVAFDWMGWGESDKPAPKDFPYDTPTMTDQLAAVVTARNLNGFTLVAHDASGPPAIDYSIAHPESVANIVLLNTYYQLTATLRPPEAILFAADPKLELSESALQGDPAVVGSLYHWQLHRFVSTKPGADAFIDNLYTEFPEARPAFVALNDVLFAEVGSRKPAQLAALTMPVAIVWGADDPYLNTGVAEEFKAHIPNATLEIVPKSGHFVQFDTPEAVARALVPPAPES